MADSWRKATYPASSKEVFNLVLGRKYEEELLRATIISIGKTKISGRILAEKKDTIVTPEDEIRNNILDQQTKVWNVITKLVIS